jgi:hypothetical protein
MTGCLLVLSAFGDGDLSEKMGEKFLAAIATLDRQTVPHG